MALDYDENEDFLTGFIEGLMDGDEITSDMGSPPDGQVISDGERWYEVVYTGPEHPGIGNMPELLQGGFRTMGELLSAVYRDGVDFARSVDMTPEQVAERRSHLSNHLAVQVCFQTIVTTRETVG